MSRELPVNVQVVDQFPVFELDGYTPHSGLVQANFDVQIFRDGVEQVGHAFTIAEIGTTGQYRFVFTPNSTAFWLAVVSIPYNREVWGGAYDIVDESTTTLYEMVRRALGLIHENIYIDETVYDPNSQLETARVRLFSSAADVDLATDGGSPPPGGTDPQHVAAYQVITVWEGVNRYKVFKQKLEP